MNPWSFQKMTGDNNELGKKSRAGLALPGGYPMKESSALDHIAQFHGINNISHFPQLREPYRQRPSFGPPKQKKDRPRQLVPVSKKILAIIPMDFGVFDLSGYPSITVVRKREEKSGYD